MKILLFLVHVLIIASALPLNAQFITPPRPDDYGPAGTALDRIEPQGRLVASYHLDVHAFAGHRDGTRRISDAVMLSTAGENFRIIPTRMTSQVHVISLAYSITDDLLARVEIPVVFNQMTLMERDSTTYRTQSGGTGNLAIMGMYRALDWQQHHVYVHAGFTVATGSTTQRDIIPDSEPESIKLPYIMQTGSGTADFVSGLTYRGKKVPFTWGVQLQGVLRGGDNAHSYRFGHYFGSSAWGKYRMDAKTSFSTRLFSEGQGAIEGGDPAYSIDVNARNIPTVFPEYQGYQRVGVGVGFNTYVWNGVFAGLRLGMELRYPFYQNMSGPQLEQDISFGMTLRYVVF